MVSQVVLVLLLQLIYAIFYLKYGFKVASVIGRRVCPVCFAVGSTWLTLLIIKYSGLIQINKFLIALLFAESVAGIANLVDEFTITRQVKLSEPLLKFGIVIYGTFAVAVFALAYELIGLVLFVPVVTFGFLALTPIRKTEQPKDQKDVTLESKLKNCC